MSLVPRVGGKLLSVRGTEGKPVNCQLLSVRCKYAMSFHLQMGIKGEVVVCVKGVLEFLCGVLPRPGRYTVGLLVNLLFRSHHRP